MRKKTEVSRDWLLTRKRSEQSFKPAQNEKGHRVIDEKKKSQGKRKKGRQAMHSPWKFPFNESGVTGETKVGEAADTPCH